ncbi:MAG: hypothetical protein HZB29_12420 [Nitrospinae bacterium]|nr:hypothetical protein [Nitrospinota bacterium]
MAARQKGNLNSLQLKFTIILRCELNLRQRCDRMPEIEKDLLRRLKRLVQSKAGLRVNPGNDKTLETAITSRMKSLHISSPEDYCAILESSAQSAALERKELARFITVGETYFFRDSGQFSLIRRVILPELIKRHNEDKTLRIWSAGCSTGEEPYSIAMAVDELLPAGNGWNIFIAGTDLREDFLAKAKSAIYGDWSFRLTSPKFKERYFKKNSRNEWELDGRIRGMVTFTEADLAFPDSSDSGALPGEMDLILCRNLLLYYGREFAGEIAERLAAALNEEGYLLTGHGELYSTPVKGLKCRIFPESAVYQRITAQSPPKRQSTDTPAPVRFDAAAIKRPARTIMKDAARGQTSDIAAGALTINGASDIESLLEKGEYGHVVKKAGMILAEDPKSVKILCLAARALANMGDHDGALRYLQRAVEADWNAMEPHYLISRIAEEAGDIEMAKDSLRKVIYLAPAFAPAFLDLAAILENDGDLNGAIKMRKAALDALNAMPDDSAIEYYEGITAAQLRERIEIMVA